MGANPIGLAPFCHLSSILQNPYYYSGFFRHSRENGNPGCLWGSKARLDTRFRGYDGWGGSIFCWCSAGFSKSAAVVL
jgi:hypothetical protein